MHSLSIDEQKKHIYFDNHATTQLLPEIREELNNFFENTFGNASSLEHKHGNDAKNILNDTNENRAKYFA